MEIEEEYCRNCGRDRCGFRADETQPEAVVSLLEKKIAILEERLA